MTTNRTVGNDGLGAVTALAGAAVVKVGSFAIPDRFDLSQHASLIRIKISAWSARAKCDDAAEAAATVGGADIDVVDAYIRHVAKDHPLKKAVDMKVNEARNWYKDNTAFWDGGGRLVTNLQYEGVMKKLRALRAEFYQAVEHFLDGLPEMEATAATKQGKYSGTFPSRSELERRFKFDIIPSAIADPNDIRLKHVSAETAREIEASTRQMQAEKVTEIMTRLVDRIAKAMEHFKGQMESDTQGYHGTAVSNIQELAAIIPELNLTQDAGLNNVARHMAETFANVTVPDLKKDPKKRDEMKEKAIDIMQKVKGMKVSKKI